MKLRNGESALSPLCAIGRFAATAAAFSAVRTRLRSAGRATTEPEQILRSVERLGVRFV